MGTRCLSWLRQYGTCWKGAGSIPGGVIEILWRSWLKHCATVWKVADFIPDLSLEFFIEHLSSSTVVLGSTQPLTGMSVRGKCGRCVGLKTLPHTVGHSVTQ